MFCSQCGSRQESQARFCTVCGRSFAAPSTGAREAPSPIPSPPPESGDIGARPSGPPSAGEVSAFAALYEQHALEIHDFLLRTVRDGAAAEDLTQMTFLRAFERRSTLSDPGKVRPWLFSIAHHLALNSLSRSRPTEDIDARYELAAPQRGPEDQVIAQESAELVWAAARSLEPRQYAVLDLATRHQMTTPEIAEALEVESSHAAVLVHRAREALGNAVQQLLVARRRTHCERLAELVPAGVSELTPEQRASVDHHMRRCPNCQAMAARLTEPAVILGGIALVAMPALLNEAHRQALSSALLTGAHLAAPLAVPPVSPPAPALSPTAPHAATPPLVAHHALRAAWIKPVALAAMAVVVVGASVGIAKVLTGGHPASGGAASQPGSSSPRPSTPLSWSVASSPDLPAGNGGSLNKVVCPSANDCWAVGTNYGVGSSSQALIEQNTGSGWSIVSSPNPSGSEKSQLWDVACVSADECWAVGYYTQVDDGNMQTLIEHYAGSDWSIVPSPNPPNSKWVELGRVTCVGASDCWATGITFLGSGSYLDLRGDQANLLIEHYAGSGWSIVPSPTPSGSTQAYLYNISCVGAADCWAVGYYNSAPLTSAANAPTFDQTLIEHDAGSGWSIVPSPNRSGSADSLLTAVSCVSAGDCWAIGSAGNVTNASVTGNTTLIEHDAGSGWSIVPGPNVSGTADVDLEGMTCVSARDCWAVGNYITSAASASYAQLLIEHYGGTGWTIVSSPNPSGSTGAVLWGVTCVSSDECWAMGNYTDADGNTQTLIEQGH